MRKLSFFMIKEDKKGMEMAFTTLVVIILAVIILGSIIFIFTNGSAKFKDLISVFSSKSNVDSVVDNCNSLADTNQRYEYCCSSKTIKLASGIKLELSCNNANNMSWGGSIKKISCEGVC